jgi:type I restriction enzyme M protein
MAVVLDTGAVSRGSGNQGANRERDIRKAFVEKDWVEAVVLMPENLFYNTTAPGIILVINKNKNHKGEIVLVNASTLFAKGRPKNYLTDESIQKVFEIYSKWKDEEGISKIIKSEEAVKNDYNLSPSRYVSQNGEEEVVPIEEAIVLLREAEEERVEADKKVKGIFGKMGFEM